MLTEHEDRPESEMSGTEAWVHGECQVGRAAARQDYLAIEKRLVSSLAKSAYVNELSRLLGLDTAESSVK